MKFFIVAALCSLAYLGATPTTSANVQFVAPTLSLEFTGWSSNSHVALILEQSFHVLPQQITLETLNLNTEYGLLTPLPGTTANIAAGTRVDVWMLHSRASTAATFTGSVDFQAPILGFGLRSTCFLGGVCPTELDGLGHPSVTYPMISLGRGLELLLGDRIRQNSASSINFRMVNTALTMDQIRIVTLAPVTQMPEPSTWLSAALPLLGLLGRRYWKRS